MSLRLAYTFIFIAVIGFAQTTPPQTNQNRQQPAADANVTQTPYLIGPGDVLMVSVRDRSDVRGSVYVGSNGMISVPLIGQVKVDGLTAQQLKDVLTQRLKGFITNPEVDVQLVKFKPLRF